MPAYNAADTIGPCLEALLAQDMPRQEYEIIVVDDGSTDGTAEAVRKFPGVRLFRQEKQGPAAARNLGAQQARGEILLFTDADCCPTPEWAAHLSAPLRQEAEIVGAKGAYLTGQQELLARFVQLEYEEKYGRMSGEKFIDFIDTYAAAYRRDVFLKAGGFDTGFPTASVEDQELSFRLAAQGCKMVFVPQARVYHHHASSLKAYLRKKLKIGYWKVWVHLRHPKKMLRDSHTPQSLKLQILLAYGLVFSLLASPLWPGLLWAALACAGAFFLSTLPFSRKAFPRDPFVAFFSPLFLFLRALALGAGLGVGVCSVLLRGKSR
ncbi:MAG TPA: glycosyltransferase [Anaerolineae bacterium]|nr:glycosyltransferase [Anaerolineae bacterium]